MNFSYQVEQVAYWLNEGETAQSIVSKNLAPELTSYEIALVAKSCDDFKRTYTRPPVGPSSTPSLRSVIFGVLGILSGLLSIAAKKPVIGCISLIGGIAYTLSLVFSSNESSESKNQDFNIAKSQMLDKLADQLKAERQAA